MHNFSTAILSHIESGYTGMTVKYMSGKDEWFYVGKEDANTVTLQDCVIIKTANNSYVIPYLNVMSVCFTKPPEPLKI